MADFIQTRFGSLGKVALRWHPFQSAVLVHWSVKQRSKQSQSAILMGTATAADVDVIMVGAL
jgi:hypothetical protein